MASETTTEHSPVPLGPQRTPEQEMAEKGAGVAPASELAIEDINPLNAHLFREHRWHDYFARLRAEDPVHFNELETSGRYWSLTKYEHVREVDGDAKRFSSAKGITLGLRVEDMVPEQRRLNPFISMDPPTHTEQRKTVRGVSAPSNLRNLEPIIRERTIAVLDSLPEGETFDWVDTVSIELTTNLLATLFDFPWEDRRMLTRWSDIVFAIPEPGGVVESIEQKRDELTECVRYFETLWEDRRVNPGHDLVSMLVHGDATSHMPTIAHLGNLLLLIVGGNDTTRNTMSGSVSPTLCPRWCPRSSAGRPRCRTCDAPQPATPKSAASRFAKTTSCSCGISRRTATKTSSTMPRRSTSCGPTPIVTCHSATASTSAWEAAWQSSSCALSGKRSSSASNASKCRPSPAAPSPPSSTATPTCQYR